MTERLFDTDSYLWEFDARVLSCTATDGGFAVVTDATAFSPEGGGQASDLGTLGGAEVRDVRTAEGIITHFTDRPLAVGATVHGSLDAARRLRHMQNHSGEHIVTGIFHNEYGMNNVGFHLGHEDVTLDLDGTVDQAALRRAEYEANRIVAENRHVRAWYPTPKEREALSYRSKKEIDGAVRLVEIENHDICACCAPHVRQTGEIGGIKLISAVRYKGGTRIHMKCGFDAIDEANVQYDRVCEISRLLSLPGERIAQGVKKLSDDLAAAKRQIAVLRRERLEQTANGIGMDEKNACLFLSDADMGELRMLAETVARKTGGRCAVFSGSDTDGYGFVLCDMNGDFDTVAAELRRDLGASGGGKAPFLQGRLRAEKERILRFFNRFGDTQTE